MAKVELTIDKITIDPEFFTEAMAAEVCEQEVTNTIANTVSKLGGGKNVDGGAAKPGGYSPSYERAIKKGYKSARKKAGNTTPNLRLTGELLESYQAVRIPGGAEGRFVGGHKGGLSNSALMGVQEGNGYTNIVAFGKDDEKRIEKRFEDEVGKAFDRAVKVGKG